MLDDLLLLLFPEHCIECNKAGNALCAICERTITTRPLALSPTIATLFDYKNPLVKKALWALKYHRKRSLGKYFGIALYREFFKQLSYANKEKSEQIILVPIPASRSALARRGYNHAAVIAEMIVRAGKEDGLHLHVDRTILFKRRENAHQAQVHSRDERKKNVENVFYIKNGERIAGKTIILIDDVVTTGATIAAARGALLEAQPKRILAVVAAH